ncbi:60S ribosomal protein L28-1 [Platanthera zijinensis]|uniref:60S ribosomal protein L28-1 n=1 Tax=Platanthera zijinensis TaxID=2320716 RepID=A0AAP0BSQ3_9ASPA
MRRRIRQTTGRAASQLLSRSMRPCGRAAKGPRGGGPTRATVPDPLIWEIVRKNNAFLVKQFGNGNAKVQFSKEKNNLFNVHSFKYFGCDRRQQYVRVEAIALHPGGGA